ncbi:MAG: hypothetical protein ACXW25_05555, partial [Rhodospirillales bacterium]
TITIMAALVAAINSVMKWPVSKESAARRFPRLRVGAGGGFHHLQGKEGSSARYYRRCVAPPAAGDAPLGVQPS